MYRGITRRGEIPEPNSAPVALVALVSKFGSIVWPKLVALVYVVLKHYANYSCKKQAQSVPRQPIIALVFPTVKHISPSCNGSLGGIAYDGFFL